MKKTVLTLMLISSTLFSSEIHWEKDFESAVAKAQKEKKPIFFTISSHYCKWCLRLDRGTFRDKKVIEALNASYVNVISYTDEKDYIPRQLWLPGTPGMWFLNSDGKPLFQPIRGYAPASDLVEATKIVMKEFNKINRSKSEHKVPSK